MSNNQNTTTEEPSHGPWITTEISGVCCGRCGTRREDIQGRSCEQMLLDLRQVFKVRYQ